MRLVKVRLRCIENNGNRVEWLEPYLDESRRETVDDLIQKVRDELDDSNEPARCREDIEQRRRSLDENNRFSARSDYANSAGENSGDEIPF